jgi:aminoglycoside phosphotransferase (APT) family kinase protein
MLVHDEGLPATGVLTGDEAHAMVDAAYGTLGLTVVALEVRQVLYEPGQSMSVRYAASVADPARPEDVWLEAVVAAIDRDGPVEGTLVLGNDEHQVGVFRWPHDPGLPGLPAAADTSINPQWWEPCGEDLDLEVLTYRPGRRVVIRGSGRDGEVYVKVLSPRRARRTVRRLRDLRAAGLPVPRVIEHVEDSGVVVLAALPGRTLRSLMTEGDSAALPDPAELVDLLDRLPSAWVENAREVQPPTVHAARHARLVAGVLPELRDPLDELVSRLARVPDGPRVAVHGDFHDDQILVQDGAIVGLLDVDGAGHGARVDDLGTFLGHVANRGLDVHHPLHVAYLDQAHARFADGVDRRLLAAQAAATIVGLATGPYRVQEDHWQRRTRDRVRLAQQWAEEV